MTKPETSGLTIYTSEAPLDWDFRSYNYDQQRIQSFLSETKSERVDISYRQNRAAIFNSDLFHESGDVDFRDGYENRRINITMLYGDRGS